MFCEKVLGVEVEKKILSFSFKMSTSPCLHFGCIESTQIFHTTFKENCRIPIPNTICKTRPHKYQILLNVDLHCPVARQFFFVSLCLFFSSKSYHHHHQLSGNVGNRRGDIVGPREGKHWCWTSEWLDQTQWWSQL